MAYIDRAGAFGNTHLMMSAMNNAPNVTKMLLDSGANPFIKNNYGQTAMDIAIDTGNKVIYDLLLEYILKHYKLEKYCDIIDNIIKNGTNKFGNNILFI